MQFNLLFKTAKDSNGHLWACDNGKLTMEAGMGVILKEYDIKKELQKQGKDVSESFSNKLVIFGSRIFVTRKNKRKLTIAKDGYLKLIDLVDMVPNYYPELESHRLDPVILKFKQISGVVWTEGKPVLMNSTGFYFWK